jgi:RimJ/RimL family protein N-acetyltransferase
MQAIRPASTAGLVLETPRLILRPPIAEDFDGFCEFHADEQTMKYLGGVVSKPEVWRRLRVVAGGWHLDGFHFFSVIEKSSSSWIGRIGPLYPFGWPEREVGWGLLSRFWGQGYAKEAAAICMDYVFDALDWERVIHTIHPENTASSAIAQSLGSYNQGPGRLPAPFADVPIEIWGQTREEWRARQRNPI